MPNFDTLPGDVLRLLLILSAPATIRRCQRVCRSLRNLIKLDTYMQYLLDLDAYGYVEPINPRLDMTYSKKREVIRSHRLRWNNPQSVSPTTYELPNSEYSSWWTYIGGVYIWDVKVPNSSSVETRQLHFCQLPSSNSGLEYRHWAISEICVDDQDFAVDPEQDLLVVLKVPNSHQGERVCNLHIRSMSTNNVHPRASPDHSVLVYKPLLSFTLGITFDSEIFGDLLAVMFLSGDRRIPSCIVVWNWTTGTELVRIKTLDRASSFTLLSEDLLVLPRSADSNDIYSNDPGGAYRFLDAYRFDPQAIASSEPVHVASFALPALNHQGLQPTVLFRCAPATGAMLGSSPKVFDLARDNRLLCLEFIYTYHYTRTLCISSSGLLDILANHQARHTSHVDVPWVDWAEKASWADIDDILISSGRPGSGQRKVGLDSKSEPRLVVLDFDQHRVYRASSDEQTAWEICTPISKTHSINPFNQVEEAVFCGRKDLARKKYAKVTFPARDGVSEGDRFMVDDERVIVEMVGSREIKLLVYSF